MSQTLFLDLRTRTLAAKSDDLITSTFAARPSNMSLTAPCVLTSPIDHDACEALVKRILVPQRFPCT